MRCRRFLCVTRRRLAAPGTGILHARVLVLVAVDAQQLPVRAVGRIVVVVAVLVVHGQLAQSRGRKFPRAARADPGQELERLLAVGVGAAARHARFYDFSPRGTAPPRAIIGRMRASPSMRGLGELSGALLGEAAGWWRTLRFGAVALVIALSPSAYDRETRAVAARQIYFSAWQVLAGFMAVAVLLSWVLIGIVVETSRAYGVAQYALELVLRALPLELLPLGAALFVALRSGAAINTEVADRKSVV